MLLLARMLERAAYLRHCLARLLPASCGGRGGGREGGREEDGERGGEGGRRKVESRE